MLTVRALFGATFVFVLVGCSSYSLFSVKHKNPNDAGAGVSYLLPMQFVRVVVEHQKAPTPAELKKKIAEFTEAVETLNKQCRELKTNQSKLEAQLKGQKPGEGSAEQRQQWQVAHNGISTQLALCDAEKTVAEVKKAVAEIELLHAGDAKYVDKIALKLDPPVGDPKHRFVVKLEHEMNRDDVWQIKTTAAGLLTSSDLKSTDRTADVLVELSRFAGAVVVQSATPVAGEPPKRKGPYAPFKLERILDVSKAKSVGATCGASSGPSSEDEINACLSDLGVNFKIRVKELHDAAADDAQIPMQRTCSAESCTPGLVYRRPRPYVIDVVTCARPEGASKPGKNGEKSAEQSSADAGDECDIHLDGTGFVTESVVVSVPNGAPLEVIPYESVGLVTSSTKTQFADGMLTTVDVDRPSELLAAAQTPYRMLQGFGQALREVSPVRVDYTNRQRDAAQAEANYFDAQKRALEARLAYEKALAAAAPPPE